MASKAEEAMYEAVKKINAPYRVVNKDYSNRQLAKINGAEIYVVEFTGGDNNRYTNWVCAIGGEYFAAHELPELLATKASLMSRHHDPAMIRLLVVSALAVIFALALIIMGWRAPSNPVMQTFANILALLIGYLVGKEAR